MSGDRVDVPGDEPGDRGQGIKPVIDRVFPFDQAIDAYKYQASGQMVGKVVIRM